MMLDGLRIYLHPSQRRLAHDTRYGISAARTSKPERQGEIVDGAELVLVPVEAEELHWHMALVSGALVVTIALTFLVDTHCLFSARAATCSRTRHSNVLGSSA